MRMRRVLLVLALFGLSGCPDEPVLDHFWPHERCELHFESPIDWSGMSLGQPLPARATAYLRRGGGASSLVVQVDGYEIGIADPYPSGPLIRFAISHESSAPAELRVVPDASDVRGPLVVEEGRAWLIETSRADKEKPLDDWRFGQGTLSLTKLSLTERDTKDRNFVTLEASFDFSSVKSGPLPGEEGELREIGGALHLRCADDAVMGDGGLEEGGISASNLVPLL